MERDPPPSGRPASPEAERRAAERDVRRAAALRANLRRRKSQGRAREDAGKEARDAGDPPPAPAEDRGDT